MTVSNGRNTSSATSPAMSCGAPLWNIPHQPRLDWQMWFAALDNPQRLRWFWRFMERLLENEPTVTALLARNPFADKPPVYVRAQFYDYSFAGSEEKAAGQWWNRRLLGQYFAAGASQSTGKPYELKRGDRSLRIGSHDPVT